MSEKQKVFKRIFLFILVIATLVCTTIVWAGTACPTTDRINELERTAETMGGPFYAKGNVQHDLDMAKSCDSVTQSTIATILTMLTITVFIIVYLATLKLRVKVKTNRAKYKHLESRKTWRLTKVAFSVIYVITVLILGRYEMILAAVIGATAFYPFLLLVRTTYLYIVGHEQN